MARWSKRLRFRKGVASVIRGNGGPVQRREMKSFIQEAGLQVTGLYGSLAGETYDADFSQRMILVGQPAD